MNYIKAKFLKGDKPSGRAYSYCSEEELHPGDMVMDAKGSKLVVLDDPVDMSWVETYGADKVTVVKKYLERKAYSSYAFEKDEREKSKINHEIYEKLKEKWRVSDFKDRYNAKTREFESINFDEYDLIYTRKAGHCHGEYTIHKNITDLSDDELALIFDGGNLCFGYRKKRENFFYIFED